MALAEHGQAVAIEAGGVLGRTGLTRIAGELLGRQRTGQAHVLTRAFVTEAGTARVIEPLCATGELGLLEYVVIAIVVGTLGIERGIGRKAFPCVRTGQRNSPAPNWPPSTNIVPRRLNFTGRRVTMLTTPPVAPSPYSTLAPPRVISMRSTLSIGMVDRMALLSSFSDRRTPSSTITIFWLLLVPKPRRSD
jgi:hypothetical protein